MSDNELDLRLEMRSDPRLLAPTRAMIGAYARRMGFDELTCGQIGLAVDEALCNVIKHGYGGQTDRHIWITCRGDDTPARLEILLEDEGQQVDPETIRGRDLDDIRPGGLGVFIIRKVMDEVRYERRDAAGMRLRLRKSMGNEEHESKGQATA